MVLRVSRAAGAVAALLLLGAGGAQARPAGGVEWAFVAVRGADRLVAIDPEAGRIVARLRIAEGPDHVAVSRDRRLVLVSSPTVGAVTLVDALRARVAHVFRGLGRPERVAFSPDSRFAYVVEARYGTLAVLELAPRRLATRVWVGRGVHDLAVRPDGRRVWVTREAWTQRSPSVVDTTRPNRARVIGRAGGRGIRDVEFTHDGLRVWATYWRSGIVGRIRAYQRLGSLQLHQDVGSVVHRMHVSADGTPWVADARHGAALGLSPHSGRVRQRIAGCPAARDVAVGPGRGRVVVACAARDFVVVFDPVTTTARRFVVGPNPSGTAVAFVP